MLKATEVETSTVTRKCPCGETFHVAQVKIGGRVLPGSPMFCPACLPGRMAEPGPEEDRGPRLIAMLDHAGVNIRKHGGCTLDNWEAGDGTSPVPAAREFLAELAGAAWSDAVRGLYLCGDTGTGKTHLAVGVLREALLMARIEPNRVVFDRAARLITEIQDTYGTGSTEKVLAKRERATLWVLDDLGAEKATEDVLRILTDLLSAREAHPTVITSNYAPSDLAGRWSSEGWARLSSRLATQNFRAVRVSGKDRRFVA